MVHAIQAFSNVYLTKYPDQAVKVIGKATGGNAGEIGRWYGMNMVVKI